VNQAVEAPLRRSRLRIRDLLNEAVAGVMSRPLRAALTTLGTVLGIGALVATLGISKTAGNQIERRFDELAATQVTLRPATSGPNNRVLAQLPWDVEGRLLPLNGVEAAGAFADVSVGDALIRSVPIRDPRGQNEFQMQVIAASPGLLDALRGTVLLGRTFDVGHVERADRVVVLGSEAARRLGVDRVDNLPAIYIGEDLYTVIGVVGELRRERSLTGAVWLPSGTAADRFGTGGPQEVVVETAIGATGLIAGQAPVALSPNAPEALRVNAPLDPRGTQERVRSDVNALFLVLGLVSLIVGAIGIANVTLVTVLERVGEIGLRRALGAARRHIALQFLVESTAIGLVGGVLGAAGAVLVIVGVAASQQWTPVLDPWVPLAAPVLGAFVGLVAGLYPSLRAASLEPVEALRAGT
jgi:ABC-type antimicrobial peptide transport system permease subunit